MTLVLFWPSVATAIVLRPTASTPSTRFIRSAIALPELISW